MLGSAGRRRHRREPPGRPLLRYHRLTLRRFLLIALPLVLLLIALFNLGVELAGLTPDLGPMVGWKSGRVGLPGPYVLGTWALEALALTALFLLVDGRGGWLVVNGLAAAWIGWVFRGPLLVLTVAGAGGRAGGSWWPLAWRWFLLYTAAGLVLATAAKIAGLRPPPRPPAAAGEPAEPDRPAQSSR